MGALHVNGQKATGVNITFADGMFIDADNVIFTDNINEGTIVETTYSYTATEDCYVYMGGMTGSSADATADFYIDGQKVGQIAHIDYKSFSINYYLKKGQTLQASNLGYWYYIKVYGIQQGTIEGKLQPVIYSTEEREVGVWTDGKPLYERTWKFTTEIALVSNTWTDIPIGILANNIGKIIKVTGLYSTTSYSFLGAQCDTGDYVRILSSRPSNMLVDGLILQYTKTTDQPGSGTWTPDGAYAHHYSSDEKVVGTWVDGSTIYERTHDLNNLTLAANGWTDTTITLGNAQGEYTLIDAKVMISDNGVPATQVTPWSQNGKLAIFNTRTIQLTAKYITIQYTKSS